MSLPYEDAFRNRRVLVTGGAGFIGSHIARRLIDLGAHVVIIDDLSSGSHNNVPDEAKFIQATILDDEAMQDAATDCIFVFHEAAIVSVPESAADPQRCAEVNIVGTHNVLMAAKDAGVSRVIFAASAAAYGNAPALPSPEDQPPDCRSPYAASKVAAEALLTAFAHSYGLSTISLRYFNVFGPGQSTSSAYAAAISAFHNALMAGQNPTIYGDGRQTRDFVYVENIVHANLLAAASNRTFTGDVINIGTGNRINLLEVLAHMSAAMGLPVEPVFAQPRLGDIRDSVADVSKAKRLLGYETLVNFADGIRVMLESK